MNKMNKLILMSFIPVLTVLNLDAKKIQIINTTDHQVTVRAQAKYKTKNDFEKAFGMQGKVKDEDAIFVIEPDRVAIFKYKKNLKFVELMNPQEGDRLVNQDDIYSVINNFEAGQNAQNGPNLNQPNLDEEDDLDEDDKEAQNGPNLNQPDLNEEGLGEDDYIDQEEHYNEDQVVEAYLALGLVPGASRVEIKSAHRKIVLRNHPDKNPNNPEAEERFKEAQEAYDILMAQPENQDI